MILLQYIPLRLCRQWWKWAFLRYGSQIGHIRLRSIRICGVEITLRTEV